MGRAENQTSLVTALRAFTGPLPTGYFDEKEFFLTSLQSMSQYLAELQEETLAELRAAFLRELDAGRATRERMDDFRAKLDSLVTAQDFRAVSAAMAGSNEFLKQRLNALRALSRIGEEAKAAGRDPDADRQVKGAYARLNFERLAKIAADKASDQSVNAVLGKARQEVADYCAMYRVPVQGGGNLTPYSMACIDSALAAAYRLFRETRRSAGREM